MLSKLDKRATAGFIIQTLLKTSWRKELTAILGMNITTKVESKHLTMNDAGESLNRKTEKFSVCIQLKMSISPDLKNPCGL